MASSPLLSLRMVQDSTGNYSTVQYCTVHYSIVHYRKVSHCSPWFPSCPQAAMASSPLLSLRNAFTPLATRVSLKRLGSVLWGRPKGGPWNLLNMIRLTLLGKVDVSLLRRRASSWLRFRSAGKKKFAQRKGLHSANSQVQGSGK